MRSRTLALDYYGLIGFIVGSREPTNSGGRPRCAEYYRPIFVRTFSSAPHSPRPRWTLDLGPGFSRGPDARVRRGLRRSKIPGYGAARSPGSPSLVD
jgi:hypothetical protein